MAGLRARSILVTGANRGIGLELVRQLAAEPDPLRWIFACSREPDGQRGQVLRRLALSHPNLIVVKLVTNFASIREAATLVETHLRGAGLNMLINNAAIFTENTLETTHLEDMISGYTTNVVGPLMVSQAFLPLLRRAAKASGEKGLSCNKAAIINISSALGSIELAHKNYSKPVIPYRCSKADLTVEESVQGILQVFSKLSHEHSGAFVNWKGQKIPW
ncbi:uncharacterized protein PHA67_002358 isoform 4-T4 [Liasis olivaceus]